MAGDVVSTSQFTKHHCVFTNPNSPKSLAKLRLSFEAAPVALLVELAGGKSSGGTTGCNLLYVLITGVDQRTDLCGFCLRGWLASPKPPPV